MADSSFDTKVARPSYTTEHPSVLFDEAHKNIHTTGGLYKPFASLITNDGYNVTANGKEFSLEELNGYKVLVIANALSKDESKVGSAFTDEECDAVRDWVKAGGSLLLITDHAPTGAAAEDLSQRFGIEMSKGMTEDPANSDKASGDKTQLVFSRENGLLLEHPITRGQNAGELVNRVMTFTGQSLKAPVGGKSLLNLADSAKNLPATTTVEKSGDDVRVVTNYGEPVSAKGYAQAVAVEFGEGRVVVLGEAAMLTAQLDGKTKKPFGMNVQGVDNRQFALNLMHWLSGLL